MITVVDYGVGNVQAISNIFRKAGVPCRLAQRPEDLNSADRLILPGVGAFDWAMHRLETSGMRPVLDRLVIECGRPVLGICVGMQMLGETSEEGVAAGLGWIPGRIKLLRDTDVGGPVRLPHMGWNDVRLVRPNDVFRGLENDSRFYFLHSYTFEPSSQSDVLGMTDYGHPFVSVVGRENIVGVQFHPEKSHQWGVRLLLNFAGVD